MDRMKLLLVFMKHNGAFSPGMGYRDEGEDSLRVGDVAEGDVGSCIT